MFAVRATRPQHMLRENSTIQRVISDRPYEGNICQSFKVKPILTVPYALNPQRVIDSIHIAGVFLCGGFCLCVKLLILQQYHKKNILPLRKFKKMETDTMCMMNKRIMVPKPSLFTGVTVRGWEQVTTMLTMFVITLDA